MQEHCHTVKYLMKSCHVWCWICGPRALCIKHSPAAQCWMRGPKSTVHGALTCWPCCRKLGGRDLRNLKPVDLMWYDVTGVEDGIEYQILEPSTEPNATHMKVGIAPTFFLCI